MTRDSKCKIKIDSSNCYNLKCCHQSQPGSPNSKKDRFRQKIKSTKQGKINQTRKKINQENPNSNPSEKYKITWEPTDAIFR